MLRSRMVEAAEEALLGVGDEARGEWREFTNRAFHLRRRLTEREESTVGPAIDIRGTDEALHRASAVLRVVPQVEPLVREELDIIAHVRPADADSLDETR